MKDITEKLENKAAMIELGERISYGSDTFLMRQAAEQLKALRKMSVVSPREGAVQLIHKQLNYKTAASKYKDCHHYGKEELRELLDYIYQGKPETEEEKL